MNVKRFFICAAFIFLLPFSVFAVDEPVEEVTRTEEVTQTDEVSRPDIVISGPLAVYEVEPPEQAQALAYNGDVWEGSISDTILNFLSGYVGAWDNYVIYRSGQYTYTCIYGSDFSVSGSTISCPAANKVVFQSQDYTVSESSGSFSVNTGYSAYVRSDLDGYSDYDFLREVRQLEFIKTILFASFLALFIRSVLGFHTR